MRLRSLVVGIDLIHLIEHTMDSFVYKTLLETVMPSNATSSVAISAG